MTVIKLHSDLDIAKLRPDLDLADEVEIVRPAPKLKVTKLFLINGVLMTPFEKHCYMLDMRARLKRWRK